MAGPYRGRLESPVGRPALRVAPGPAAAAAATAAPLRRRLSSADRRARCLAYPPLDPAVPTQRAPGFARWQSQRKLRVTDREPEPAAPGRPMACASPAGLLHGRSCGHM